jgi:hypothetical protein
VSERKLELEEQNLMWDMTRTLFGSSSDATEGEKKIAIGAMRKKVLGKLCDDAHESLANTEKDNYEIESNFLHDLSPVREAQRRENEKIQNEKATDSYSQSTADKEKKGELGTPEGGVCDDIPRNT